MRATSNPPTPAQNADAVWDELTAEHFGSGSMGQVMPRVSAIFADYSRRTPYTYGPTSLAAGATYVPAAGTVVTVCALDGIAADDFRLVHGTIELLRGNQANEEWKEGYVGMMYCDGTNVGIKNADSVGHNLVIEGFTI